ncbi:hypothetical protein LSH36_553g01029 [Paralvinella palmiformis]|uniref:Uncharacterized protein n=1 Tax=Paralvinella palmiformis TaxID=53620 RepID=A0AAD9J842_9ANNE|nr:hypothetical protein LSH36_553g01029 [Paralvinella palmiformis]
MFMEVGIISYQMIKNLLADKSIENCTKFHGNVTSHILQYTTLRFPIIDQQLDYLNVTLIGQNLTCGSNLHVIPLTVPQTGSWKGIWYTLSANDRIHNR